MALQHRRLKAPLAPRSVIGILGSGQLGKMLAQAASRLGFRTHIYCDNSGPAFDVTGLHSVGSFAHLARLEEFARSVDVVTFEFENVPVLAAEHLAQFVDIWPAARALQVAQDRAVEKTFIGGLGIPVAPFKAIASADDLADAERAFAGMGAAILKTARLGYDGKGQIEISTVSDLRPAYANLGGVACVLEQRISFLCEISVLVARARDGAAVAYDVPRNTHAGGILRRSIVPCGLPQSMCDDARAMAERIAQALDYVGVLAVELFYLGDDAPQPLIVNEIAPRVHNSGHWTLDACAVDQFENHIRAIAGWPLGATARHSDAEMVNLIGREADAWLAIAGETGACLHHYGKREARDGRKMGHVTRLRPRTA